MRSSLARPLAVGLAAVALVAGCGTSKTSGSQRLNTDYASVLKTAAKSTSSASSSKISLISLTTVSGQSLSLTGEGAFAYATKEGTFDLTIGGFAGRPATKIAERITGGNLYLSLPGQPGFYKLSLTDLVGTSLANSSSPTSSLSTLYGVSGPVTRVGTESIRGTQTTHYSGTIDIAKALKQLSGLTKDLVEGTFAKAKVTTLPFDAYVDDQGRLRRMVQNITLTIKDQEAVVKSTIDLYDFGTKISVVVPPADQVKDGTSLLSAFKSAAG